MVWKFRDVSFFVQLVGIHTLSCSDILVRLLDELEFGKLLSAATAFDRRGFRLRRWELEPDVSEERSAGLFISFRGLKFLRKFGLRSVHDAATHSSRTGCWTTR